MGYAFFDTRRGGISRSFPTARELGRWCAEVDPEGFRFALEAFQRDGNYPQRPDENGQIDEDALEDAFLHGFGNNWNYYSRDWASPRGVEPIDMVIRAEARVTLSSEDSGFGHGGAPGEDGELCRMLIQGHLKSAFWSVEFDFRPPDLVERIQCEDECLADAIRDSIARYRAFELHGDY